MFDALVARHAAAGGGAVAVIDAEGCWSWADLAARAAVLRPSLEGRGPCAVLVPQRGDALALLAACSSLGRDVLLMNEVLGVERGRERAHALGATTFARKDGDRWIWEALPGEAVPAEGGPFIGVLTSGTTGTPKCARHTWTSLFAAVKVRERMRRGSWLLGYPLAQFAGLQVLAQSACNGGTLVIPRDPSPTAALAALLIHGAHYLTFTPTAARLLLASAGDRSLAGAAVEHVTLGGEAVDQRTIDELRAAFPGARVTSTYASTELGLLLSSSDGRAGFDAAALDGVSLRLIDGELHARRSARAMTGYAGAPAPAAWVATGDLAEVRDGRLFIVGRADDVINVGGFKVMPTVVEEAIRSVDGVMDVAVLRQRSSVLGSLLRALVRPQPGADRTRLPELVRQRCAERLPYYMVPHLIELVDSLETTASQKIVRRAAP